MFRDFGSLQAAVGTTMDDRKKEYNKEEAKVHPSWAHLYIQRDREKAKFYCGSYK